jgi:hypothetical protein
MLEFFDQAKTLLAADDDAALKWRQSNLILHRVIAGHRTEFGRAAAVAERLGRRLESLFPLLDELNRRTCPFCPEPCCIANKVWFDFIDLIFMHLVQTRIPAMQLTADTHEPCRFLSHKGCRLPRLIRPWACTQYLCATQRSILSSGDSSGRDGLKAGLQSIRGARLELEDVFCEALREMRAERCGKRPAGRS